MIVTAYRKIICVTVRVIGKTYAEFETSKIGKPCPGNFLLYEAHINYLGTLQVEHNLINFRAPPWCFGRLELAGQLAVVRDKAYTCISH